MGTVSDKKTILHLPTREADMWCTTTSILLTNMCLKEGFLLNDSSKLIGRNIEGMMYGDARRSHGSPHIKRISQLRSGDHTLTIDLMMFISNLSRMLRGERRTPFENEYMSQDEARSWLADARRRLMLKLRHDRNYLQHCEKTHTYPHENAATTEDIVRQEDIVLLLEELIKTYPPLKLSRPKKSSATEAVVKGQNDNE